MQGLMYRLAELDADSAGQVRVIDYFDALVRHGADADAMMRASASLADCVVGMDVVGNGGLVDRVRRCDPRGRWAPQPLRSASSSKDVVIGDVVVGRVWIERTGPALGLDDMLVDRMALTAAYILRPRYALTARDHTLNLLFPNEELAVLIACAALELDPAADVRVAACSTEDIGTVPSAVAARSVVVAVEGTAYFLVERIDDILSSSSRAGISLPSTASTAHLHVSSARFALSQTSYEQKIVDATELGALNLLAPGNAITHENIPDLVRARELLGTQIGVELLSTLRTYLQVGTLRATAVQLHLHHSSVAHRMTKLTRILGFAVDAVENRARAAAMIAVINSQQTLHRAGAHSRTPQPAPTGESSKRRELR